MDSPRPRLQLSGREKSLIQLASAGATDTAIANKLGISEATVGTYWGRIRIKLGPFSRTELVAIVLRAEQEEAVSRLREENSNLVEELKAAAAHDHSDSELYRRLIENAPDAMLLVTEDGAILSANDPAHELFGYEAGFMDGLDLLKLIPPSVRELHKVHRDGYVRDPRRRTMGEHLQTPALKRSGEVFFIRASLSAIETSAGLLVMCALRRADGGSS
jgi:PAS domain S-box-containing protein